LTRDRKLVERGDERLFIFCACRPASSNATVAWGAVELGYPTLDTLAEHLVQK